MTALRPNLTITAALLAAWISAIPALAQTEETAPTGEPAAIDEPGPPAEAEASVADIAGEIDEDDARLREIRSSIEPEEDIEEIAEQLDGFTDSLRALEEDLDDRTLAGMSIRGLTDLRSRWTRERDQLQGWDITLQNRSKSLADQKIELRQTVEYLEQAGVSQEGELPAPLVERIGFLLLETVEIQELLDLRLTAILTLRDQVTEMKTRCTEAIERIDESQRQARQQRFAQDHPPIWNAFARQDRVPGETPAESWSKEVGILARFATQNREQLVFQLALFVLLAALLTYLHRRTGVVEQAETDESLKAAAVVLSRPLSAALLLTLFFTRYISPQAPTVVLGLNRLLLIIPLLRLAPPLLPAALLRPLYGLFAVYVAQQLWGLVPEASSLRRLSQLGITAMLLAGTVWLMRLSHRPSSSTGTEGPGRWLKAGVLGARVGGVLLVGSLLANVLGRVRLATLLTETVLVAAYGTVVMYAMVRLLDSMTTVLLRTPALLALNVVRRHAELLKRRTSKVVRFVAVVMGAGLVLHIMDLLAPVLNALRTALDRQWSLGAFEISLGDVLAFAVSVWIAVQIARFIRFALDEDVLPRMDLPRGVPQTVSMLVYYCLLAIGFLIALAAAGIELSRLTLVIGALGVGIGFGLQNLVNNFVSGLILIFERPIKIGDIVEVGTLVGEVRRIGIRSSVVHTFSESDVIVPNGNMISQQVVNWTLTDRLRRVEIPVGVTYDSNPAEVLPILNEAARLHEGVLTRPEPYTLAHGFGRDAIELELRFWTASPDWLHIKTAVIVAVHEALEKAGIEIAFPQLDLHVRSDDRDSADGATGPGDEPTAAGP